MKIITFIIVYKVELLLGFGIFNLLLAWLLYRTKNQIEYIIKLYLQKLNKVPIEVKQYIILQIIGEINSWKFIFSFMLDNNKGRLRIKELIVNAFYNYLELSPNKGGNNEQKITQAKTKSILSNQKKEKNKHL